MKKTPENPTSTVAPDECAQVLNRLMMFWPDEPDDDESPAFLDHLSQCRSCLRKWIAFEAAAELAAITDSDSAEFLMMSRPSSGLP
jgi:hypothetical protein